MIFRSRSGRQELITLKVVYRIPWFELQYTLRDLGQISALLYQNMSFHNDSIVP